VTHVRRTSQPVHLIVRGAGSESRQHAEPRVQPRDAHVRLLPTFFEALALFPAHPDFQRESPGLELRIVTACTPAEAIPQWMSDCRVYRAAAGNRLGWKRDFSRSTAWAGGEPRSDEKNAAAGAGRSRTAHALWQRRCRDGGFTKDGRPHNVVPELTRHAHQVSSISTLRIQGGT